MTERNFKLISKYALLLSVSYVMEYAFNRYVRSFNTDLVTRTNQMLISITPFILILILNLITSLVVYRDKVTNNIKTKYVILATMLYRPIGVVAFILFSIYDSKDKENKTQE